MAGVGSKRAYSLATPTGDHDMFFLDEHEAGDGPPQVEDATQPKDTVDLQSRAFKRTHKSFWEDGE